VSSDPSMYIEVENDITSAGGSKLSRLKCNREGKEWETVLTSRILSAAGSCEVVSVACEKRTLSVFSACGRRLLPPIVLHSPISTLHCTGFYIMALTTAATLSVWNVQKRSVVVKDESLQTILAGSETTVSQILLTQHGIPVMNMSDGKAYCFNPSLSSCPLGCGGVWGVDLRGCGGVELELQQQGRGSCIELRRFAEPRRHLDAVLLNRVPGW
ncbi:PREDICTED: protein HIRA-like, partial [Gekko japonicus]|uniref:Protein HIRA-like n=1 Tax=Gekko japonicus TaxID=146911 RepID=A0ABM1KUB9_GEKJA